MGIRVARFTDGETVSWGVVTSDEQLHPLGREYATLCDLLTTGLSDVREAFENGTGSVAVEDVKLLSPVTTPTRIVCQGANYSTHREEAGMQPDRPAFNQIFYKSDTSVTGPRDDIVHPANVTLLDYEIEMGLVIGKPISSSIEITKWNFTEYVAGIVTANDVSARDVQLLEGQWYKGKSYRTFCPVGPYLYLFEGDEGSIVHDLQLTLTVNGEVRQSAKTSQLLFKPEETLTELSGIIDLMPGDLVLTGTPGGVALSLSRDELAVLMNPAVSGSEKRTVLLESQSQRPQYLRAGDEVVCEITSTDKSLHLGLQRNKVIRAE